MAKVVHAAVADVRPDTPRLPGRGRSPSWPAAAHRCSGRCRAARRRRAPCSAPCAGSRADRTSAARSGWNESSRLLSAVSAARLPSEWPPMPSMTTSSAACSVRRDRDAVLVVFAVTDQTQICILDPQARLRPRRPVSCYTSTPRRSAGRGALYHRATHPCKTAFALILTLAMIRSMTGFARRERQGPWGTLVCELRTVNHRYLETSLRLPDELKALDNEVRQAIARGAAPRQGRRQPVPEGGQRDAALARAGQHCCSMSCSPASTRCARACRLPRPSARSNCCAGQASCARPSSMRSRYWSPRSRCCARRWRS